jgi:phosphoribosylaminoimidazole-succinocarboxamide synthase
VKQDALLTLLFNSASEYVIRKDWNWVEHINSWSMLMMLICQGKTKYHKENHISLADTKKEVGLEVNTEKTN